MTKKILEFTEGELSLAGDADFIHQKNNVLKKAEDFLALQVEILNRVFQHSFPIFLNTPVPKISRGENYEGLPYRMLDYPAHFSKEGVLAVRTMFWWGNFMSAVLHISGSYLQKVDRSLLTELQDISSGFIISTSGEEWDHRPQSSSQSLDINDWEFLKITCVIPIGRMEAMQPALEAAYEVYSKLLEKF